MTELRTFRQYTMRIVENGLITYIGYAKAGSSESSAVWRIIEIDETTNTSIKFADGNTQFDNVWENYASLTYT